MPCEKHLCTSLGRVSLRRRQLTDLLCQEHVVFILVKNISKPFRSIVDDMVQTRNTQKTRELDVYGRRQLFEGIIRFMIQNGSCTCNIWILKDWISIDTLISIPLPRRACITLLAQLLAKSYLYQMCPQTNPQHLGHGQTQDLQEAAPRHNPMPQSTHCRPSLATRSPRKVSRRIA